MITEGAGTAFRIVGSFELGTPTRQSEQPSGFIPETVSISGTVLSEHHGYPLPGLTVSAYFLEPQEAASTDVQAQSRRAETVLGTAIADSDGRFQIAFRDAAIVRQKLSVLTRFADASLVLKVEANNGQVYYTSEPLRVPSGALLVTLSVRLPEADVNGNTWAMLGTRLEEARITQVHVVAQQLAAPDGHTLFADWNLETRLAALSQLEQAFLDPQNILREVASPLPTFRELRSPGTLEAFQERLQAHLEKGDVFDAFADFVGKSESFPDLFSVDWTMDLNDLQQGKIGLAVNKNIDLYRLGIEKELLSRDEHDLTGYRDYLREIWPSWITRSQPQGWTRQKAIDQLHNRFHQNFFTYDTSSQPANNILIPILTNILTAPTGNWSGFGIPPADIAGQGTRTARQYLDYLIGLSNLSAQELSLRYRLDLMRPDSALSNAVQENIATLQDFYRDGFQCDLEPVHPVPDVLKQPIVPDRLVGKAPFFLHYDEWLRQQAPFYPENFFDIKRTLRVTVPPDLVPKWRDWLNTYIKSEDPLIKARRPDWEFVSKVWDVADSLDKGHEQYYLGEYTLALDAYRKAAQLASTAMDNKFVRDFDIQAALMERKKMSVRNMQELSQFMQPPGLGPSFDVIRSEDDRSDMVVLLVYYSLYVIPICSGDIYLALGEYENSVFHYGMTTRFHVGTARETDSGGYRPDASSYDPRFLLYSVGDRPYTVDLHQPADQYPAPDNPISRLAAQLMPKYVHSVEMRYFKLRQANAMLEWADALYRTNDSSSIQRARELYKGVSFLHGETPPICPEWRKGHAFWPVHGPFKHQLKNQRENPALVSQKTRARKGFFQINAELNYYGESNDIVPPLRYRPLKETADRFSALAKTAQQDFLMYMEKLESAVIERLRLSNLLQKASLQARIAQEQIQNAEYSVTVAKEQVAAVEAQIAAKRKEIEDSQSLFSQLGDFVGGMVDFAKGAVQGGGDAVKGAESMGLVSKEALSAAGKQLGQEALLGVGWGGAAVVGGYAAFAVLGYMSMSSMAEASNRRDEELRTLQNKALPLAQGLVEAKQRDVQIAKYQKEIAQADIDLARDMMAFEDKRFLNLNFWSNLAQLAKRTMRRYLELGTRVAWLAERALAYEQERMINIIRLDYFPEKLQGVTGADLLHADLTELEATRIEGIRLSVPIKHTFSLASDFPLQFGQLKQTGRCSFKTKEFPFTLAYPGTSRYRIRAISLAISQTSFTNPLRGLLINQGVSISRPGQQDEHVIVRPAEALPISEFKLQNDMAVYSLPNETLLTFEGSALETFWEIHLPSAANTFGYDGIADVLMTFDLWAQYSPGLSAKHLANMPKSMRRWIVLSGKRDHPDAIKELRGVASTVTINFDVGALRLPTRETNRKVKNIAVFFVSPTAIDVDAQFSVIDPATSVNIAFKQGIAMSNVPPATSGPVPPPLPLNALTDIAADQRFALSIDKTQNQGVDFSGVTDVVLGIEYEADII
jgi:tetratricopeptide (TPR) repeat protein